jgi:Sensors of blue-light using FAD
MLIRLVYASTAQSGVDLNEFKRILLQAQANNHRRDLTGMLAFNSKIFLQALEGSREQINDLYAKLIRDPRHTSVTLLNYKEIEERHWANWSMGFAAPNTDNRALFLKYSQQSIFNPYNMKADAVEKMLMELASTAIALAAPAPAPAPAPTVAAAAASPAASPAAPRPSQPASLATASALPRAALPVTPAAPPSPLAPLAPLASLAPLAPLAASVPPVAASAPVPLSVSAPVIAPAAPAPTAAAITPAPVAQTDRAAVAKPESAPASGLFARFLNK